MSERAEDAFGLLAQLLASVKDSEARFAAASARCSHEELRRFFDEARERRAWFASELEKQTRLLGATPSARRTLRGGLRRLFTTVRSAARGGADQVDVAECHAGEYFLAREYRGALDEAIPASMRTTLESELREIEESLEHLRRLRRADEARESLPESDVGLLAPAGGRIDCYGISDVGRERETNQDHFLVAELSESMLIHQTSLPPEDHTQWRGIPRGQLFVVADGVGGHAGGDRASRIAVDTVARFTLGAMPRLLGLDRAHDDELEENLHAALARCEEAIRSVAGERADQARMATTLTVAYVIWPRLHVVHVGDSRCYLCRAGRLEPITTDHTLEQDLIEAGELDKKRAGTTRWSHVLSKNLGGGSDAPRPDVHTTTLEFGDTLLLCTDGLTNEVPQDRILALLEAPHAASTCAQALVTAANEAGGSDNITAIVARFEAAEDEPVGEGKARCEHKLPLPPADAAAGGEPRGGAAH